MIRDFICGEEYKPWVPDSRYEAVCTHYDQSFVLGKARKLFLHFKITENGSHNGKQIFMAFNMPYNKKVRQGSKYYKTWTMVNGGKPPSRNARLSPVIFKGKIFKIKTRTVKPLFPNGKEMPKDFWYSCVDYIDSVITGIP